MNRIRVSPCQGRMCLSFRVSSCRLAHVLSCRVNPCQMQATQISIASVRARALRVSFSVAVRVKFVAAFSSRANPCQEQIA